MNVSDNMNTLEDPAKTTVSSIFAVRVNSKTGRPKAASTRKSLRGPKNSSTFSSNSPKCNGCGDVHLRSQCPFRDATCFKCSKRGHTVQHIKDIFLSPLLLEHYDPLTQDTHCCC